MESVKNKVSNKIVSRLYQTTEVENFNETSNPSKKAERNIHIVIEDGDNYLKVVHKLIDRARELDSSLLQGSDIDFSLEIIHKLNNIHRSITNYQKTLNDEQ